MAIEIAEGVVVVTADASDISRDVGRAISRNQGPFESAGDTSARSFGSVFKGSFFGNFLGNIATDIVSSIGNAIGSGIRGAIEFGMGGIEIASGVAEASTAIDNIFGKQAAGTVQSFSKTAAGALGQSQLDALKAAQTFGVFGQAAGLAGEANAGFSTELVKTASDFASFYDTSPEDAITAIGAAMRGEYEPIRNYGLLLDEASLKNQAMSMGIYDGNGTLTAQQKILAANAMIVGDSAASYNDFAETSGGLANQQRILSAELSNAQGALGEALLPAMLELTTFANDTLVPILNDVIDTVGPMLGEALAEATPAFLSMIEAIVPYIPDFIKLGAEALPVIMDAIVTMTPTIIAIIEVFMWFAEVDLALRKELGYMMDALGWLGGIVGEVFGAIVPAFQNGADQIGSFFGTVGSAISTGIQQFGNFAGEVGANIGRAVAFIGELPGRALGAIGDLGNMLRTQGQKLIQGFIDGIGDMIGGVGDAIGGVLDFAAGFFPNSPAKRGPFSGAGWTAIEKSGGAVMTAFSSGFARPDLTGRLSGVADVFGGLAGRPALVGVGGGTAAAGAPGGYSGGRRVDNMNVTINEAEDPLGSAGRISAELRKWGRG